MCTPYNAAFSDKNADHRICANPDHPKLRGGSMVEETSGGGTKSGRVLRNFEKNILNLVIVCFL